jgi:hypothetical protein
MDATLASGATRLLAFGAAAQAMAVGLYAAIYQIANSKSQLLTLADATGTAVDQLEELDFVAEQTGASQDALHSSLQGLTEALGGAAIGQGGLETFHRLGIRVKDANGNIRDTVDVLMEVGDKLEGMDKAKATMYMGQLGIDRSMLRMLTSDVDGLRETYREMYRAVGVDSNQAAEDFRKFTGEVNGLKTMFRMVGDGVAAILVGDMGKDVVRFRQLIQENVGKIIPVLKGIVGVILRIGKAFFALTARLMTWVGMIVDWFGKLDDGTQKLILGVLAFGAAWRWLNLAFLATPIGAIVTGLIALLGLIDDFMVWKEGGDSLIDWGPWADDIDSIMDAVSGLLDILGQLWNTIKGPLFDVIGTLANIFLGALKTMMSAYVDWISVLVSLFRGDFTGAIEGVRKVFGHLWEMVKATAANFKEIFGFVGKILGKVAEYVGGGIASAQGFGDDKSGPANAPVLMPAPAQMLPAPAAAGTSINASTVVHVDGARNPDATGRAVAGQQNRVNSDLVRHARGAAR